MALVTAKTAEPIWGDKMYQERARRALPILVRQAEAPKVTPVSYSSLAQELGMSNARNLNFVLGCIGKTLESIAEDWDPPVPRLQSLVVNMQTGLPGPGISEFFRASGDFAALNIRQKRRIVDMEHARIAAFPFWKQVLETLELTPTIVDFSKITNEAAKLRASGGGGESQEHIEFKLFVAKNPPYLGLPKTTADGETEYRLPSGDLLDVSFKSTKCWVAAEVKTSRSNDEDLARGLYQCIKYQAVMTAVHAATSDRRSIRVALVLQGRLPTGLVPLRNILGVDVIELVGVG